MRKLYFSATPVKPVTVEFSSFGIERGYSTEITTFDDDGYFSGERIRFHDRNTSVLRRGGLYQRLLRRSCDGQFVRSRVELEKFQLRQVSAKKRLDQQVAFSGEYTWQTGLDTLREAKTPEFKLADSVRFEAYERLNSIMFAGAANSPIGPIPPLKVGGASGFAVAVDKKIPQPERRFRFRRG